MRFMSRIEQAGDEPDQDLICQRFISIWEKRCNRRTVDLKLATAERDYYFRRLVRTRQLSAEDATSEAEVLRSEVEHFKAATKVNLQEELNHQCQRG